MQCVTFFQDEDKSNDTKEEGKQDAVPSHDMFNDHDFNIEIDLDVPTMGEFILYTLFSVTQCRNIESYGGTLMRWRHSDYNYDLYIVHEYELVTCAPCNYLSQALHFQCNMGVWGINCIFHRAVKVPYILAYKFI